MTRQERKRILDSLPPDERLRILQRSAYRSALSPRSVALFALPFLVLVVLAIAAHRAEISQIQWIIAVVATTAVVAAGAFWPTRRSMARLDEILKNIQLSTAQPPSDSG